jgi:hypothetical protein
MSKSSPATDQFQVFETHLPIDSGYLILYTTEPVESYPEAVANSVLHRDDGPAFQEFDEDHNIVGLQWYQHGQLHRLDGPALIWHSSDGSPFSEGWYENGAPVKSPAQMLIGCEKALSDIKEAVKADQLSQEDADSMIESLELERAAFLAEHKIEVST